MACSHTVSIRFACLYQISSEVFVSSGARRGLSRMSLLGVRRRLLCAAVKPPCSLCCSLWFLLLLGAGSLLLLARLQNLTEPVLQRRPG